jgi:hypothetical protein
VRRHVHRGSLGFLAGRNKDAEQGSEGEIFEGAVRASQVRSGAVVRSLQRIADHSAKPQFLLGAQVICSCEIGDDGGGGEGGILFREVLKIPVPMVKKILIASNTI